MTRAYKNQFSKINLSNRTTPTAPNRVAIVKTSTECSNQQAQNAIECLDQYDASQQPIHSTEPKGKPKRAKTYARFDDLLSAGCRALISKGYNQKDAISTLQAVFGEIGKEHSKTCFYMPTEQRIQKALEQISFASNPQS